MTLQILDKIEPSDEVPQPSDEAPQPSEDIYTGLCPYSECPRSSGKPYSTQTWLDKHIKDKHDPAKGVSFDTPTDLKDYVGAVALQPLDEGEKAEVPPPEVTTVPFKTSAKQIISFLKAFNTFIDGMLSLMANFDVGFYTTMHKEDLKSMADAVILYIDHTGMMVTPMFFLTWNFLLIYGSMSLGLPKYLKEEREKIVKELKKQEEATSKKV